MVTRRHFAGQIDVGDVEQRGVNDVAIIRVEQLYPFPRKEVAEQLAKYPATKEIFWCQEEPMNQGAWYQIQHHLRACLQPEQVLDYTGRARSAAPACGHLKTHMAELAALLADALVNPPDGDHVSE